MHPLLGFCFQRSDSEYTIHEKVHPYRPMYEAQSYRRGQRRYRRGIFETSFGGRSRIGRCKGG